MPDNGLVTVAVCGLAMVCLGVIGIGAVLFLRSTGRIVLPSLFGSSEPSGGRRRVLSPRSRRRADLQAQADALDFDAALARAANQPNQPLAAVPLPDALSPLEPRTRVIQPPWDDDDPANLIPYLDDE